MSTPEDNPADDHEMTLEEWNEWKASRAVDALERGIDPDDEPDEDEDDAID